MATLLAVAKNSVDDLDQAVVTANLESIKLSKTQPDFLSKFPEAQSEVEFVEISLDTSEGPADGVVKGEV